MVTVAIGRAVREGTFPSKTKLDTLGNEDIVVDLGKVRLDRCFDLWGFLIDRLGTKVKTKKGRQGIGSKDLRLGSCN